LGTLGRKAQITPEAHFHPPRLAAAGGAFVPLALDMAVSSRRFREILVMRLSIF
jgi:hypothetical protein